MTRQEALSRLTSALGSRPSARTLLAHLLSCSEVSLVTHPDVHISAQAERRLRRWMKRIAASEPVAYLIGSAPFLQHTFKVTRSTLIPRPETEELVHHVLRAWKPAAQNVVTVDIGTGSGCIAVSLAAARSSASIIASDISKRALNIARLNAKSVLGAASSNLSFIQTPLLSPMLRRIIEQRQPAQLFLVANLPYLPQSDRYVLQKSVTAYEPARALYADDHGNALILRCLHQLCRFLKQHPTLSCTAWFELDQPQASRLEQCARTLFPTAAIRLIQDENGRSRFLEIVR